MYCVAFISKFLQMHESANTCEGHIHSLTNMNVFTYMLKRDRADSTALFLPSLREQMCFFAIGSFAYTHTNMHAHSSTQTRAHRPSFRDNASSCSHSSSALMGFMCGDWRERFGSSNWNDWKYPRLCCSLITAVRTPVRWVSIDKRSASQLTSIVEKWGYTISVQRPRSKSHSGKAPAWRSKLPREISAASSMSFSVIVCSICLLLLFCLLFYCFCP